MKLYRFYDGGWALWIGKLGSLVIRISNEFNHLEIFWRGGRVFPKEK